MMQTSSSGDQFYSSRKLQIRMHFRIQEIYEFGRKLGQGSYGAVYEATHIETQTKWAIKEVYKPAAGTSKVAMVENEIIVLRSVNHAHIIYLEAIYTSPLMIYLVTELCEGGDLKQLLQQKNVFTEDETRKIIFCLADAVAYLHKSGIIHRDLKLENILVKNCLDEDDGRFDIKVADFGMSVKTSGVGIENIQTEACGTLIYMAPEMMSGRGYSHWCDNWSIGVIMYMLLCGKPPFFSKTKERLLRKIMTKEVQFDQPIWENVSDAAKYLLTRLLKPNPAYRMPAPLLLENPWIQGDTRVPSGPSNALEMMHHYMEHKEKTVEESSLVSFEDTLEPFLALLTPSSKTNSSGAELSPEGDSSSCTPSTANRTSHVGGKHPVQLRAKQRRPQDKKDLRTGQKPTSDLSKAEEERHSSSSREGLSSANLQLLQSPVINQNNTKKKKKQKNHTTQKNVRK
ncbi:serine/threonine-protein kinase 33 isoform X2 [Kryptolebias marmoratus]|uniref:serine/threonine-protein kinase 33 isoform X2 n=1 Tax=Kryptolebias marmoratus TaxID=37003 RepID=UPI000D530F73|nr:serine/threonine-protein kinase 33 isoform X2 [Kryptolebias marmoratus]